MAKGAPSGCNTCHANAPCGDFVYTHDRLLDLNHASRLAQLDAAFHALGLSVNVQLDKPAARRKSTRARRVWRRVARRKGNIAA